MMKGDDSADAFECILEKIRPFGYFQKRLLFLTTLLQVLAVTVLLYLDVLQLHQTTPPVCEASHTNSDKEANTSNPLNVTEVRNNSCVPGSPHNTWIVPQWMSQTDGADYFSYVWLSQCCGIVVGAVVGGFIGDLAGRKVTLFVNFGLMSLSHGCVIIFDTWFIFLSLRILTGIFAGGFIVTSLVLIVEHVGHYWRDVCMCACLWSSGVVLLLLEAFITRNWRYLAIVTSASATLGLGTYFIFPESFRWYSCRQRFSDSEAALREIISCNATSLPEITVLCDRAKSAVINTMHKRPHTYFDLIHTRVLCKSTAIVIFAWFVTCAVYRCLLERLTTLTGNIYVDTCLSYGIDIPLVYSSVVINKCIGRRWCIFLYSTSAGFALLCILVLHITNNLDKDENMISGISLFGKLGVGTTIVLISLVTLEQYPTAVRCMGVAVGLSSGVIGLIAGRQLNIVFTVQHHYTLPYICYGVMMAVVGMASLAFQETSNKPLLDLLPSRHRMIGMKEVTRLTNAWESL